MGALNNTGTSDTNFIYSAINQPGKLNLYDEDGVLTGTATWGSVLTLILKELRAMQKDVDALTLAVATLGGDLDVANNSLDMLTTDPYDGPNVIVDAVRYANANPTP